MVMVVWSPITVAPKKKKISYIIGQIFSKKYWFFGQTILVTDHEHFKRIQLEDSFCSSFSFSQDTVFLCLWYFEYIEYIISSKRFAEDLSKYHGVTFGQHTYNGLLTKAYNFCLRWLLWNEFLTFRKICQDFRWILIKI